MNVTEKASEWLGPQPEVILTNREQLLPWITDKHLSLLLPVVLYWAVSFFWFLVDYFEVFEKYRIHTPEELKKNIVGWKTVLRAVFCQHIIQTASGLLLERFQEPEKTGFEAYSIWKIARNLNVSMPVANFLFNYAVPFGKVLVAFFIIDTWQYVLHRFMHGNKWAYKTMHSVHHRLYVPYAFGALYNSLLEGFLLDTLGTGIASEVMGLSDRENIFLFCFSTLKTIDDHCGYELPWDPLQIIFPNRATYHDIHHQHFGLKTNFSQPFFVHWDTLLGTKYSNTEAYIADNKRIREEKFAEKKKKE